MSESTDAETARRIAAGPLASELAHPPGEPPATSEPVPFDPLRLCIFATIALLGWLGGPVTLLVFAIVGFVGYAKARRAGLTRSKCYLRDTRLVLAYLGFLTAAALGGCWVLVQRLLG